MTTAFKNYNQPLSDRRLSASATTPFGQHAQQGQSGGYQSIPQATQQTAAATKGGKLAMNQQASYLSYLDQVVGGTLPGDEADKRAAYIPQGQGTAGYSGSGYVDRNVAMAGSAIPAAYEYANLKNDDFDYGVNRLETGGPSSTRNTAMDFLNTAKIASTRDQAESWLRRALIPENLSREASDRLANQWTTEWTPEFNRLKSERADEQAKWWGESDWATNSIRPGSVEVVTPESQRMVSPERQEMVSPEKYTPESWGRNTTAWNQYINNLDATQIYPGQERHFYYDKDTNGNSSVRSPQFNRDMLWWTVGAGEEGLHDRALEEYTSWANSIDPRAGYEGRAEKDFGVRYQSGVDYQPDWAARAGIDLWTEAGNPASTYQSYLDDPNGPVINPNNIDYRFQIPQGMYTHTPEERIAAKYETIPAAYETVPAVTRTNPATLRQGFQTMLDPITGVAIPDWWGSNSQDLTPFYGQPDWYMR